MLQSVVEGGLGLIDLLQIRICYALIQARNRKLRIRLKRLLKLVQSLLKELLIHVGAAQVVQASGFDGIRLTCRNQEAERSNERSDESR